MKGISMPVEEKKTEPSLFDSRTSAIFSSCGDKIPTAPPHDIAQVEKKPLMSESKQRELIEKR